MSIRDRTLRTEPEGPLNEQEEALLRECVLDEILRRVGCPRELRVQLAVEPIAREAGEVEGRLRSWKKGK